ncbi:aldo/keto reductase [Candidatus Nephthysia bennettiae]|uniref:Aldo/keto reductase n=1 Tax=Candidatus Nephthysia bennettiae TaxID=3127016 RepID=A0A934K557_9BACT|nr:aldo/keto reductase [Candidatus Dormibacteraeota bacterium]MBJ7612716.1 aldo/keto reductase [Candidatus Dormibacteraeota bacterium]
MVDTVPRIRLNDGTDIPQLGLGVFQVPEDEVAQVVRHALEVGYRSIDTAAGYENEEGVGEAIASSGLPREEIYVTTKLTNSEHGYDAALRGFEESRRKLGLTYVDLYLIHWPQPGRDLYMETWRAFEKLKADELVRSIGVSNFLIPHLERLLAESDVVPVVNQIEVHPGLQQRELREFCWDHDIVPEAYSPLARGEMLSHPVIVDLAAKYGRTPAQVVLRWHIQEGNIVIPKSTTPERIKENFELFDFELSEEDMKLFDSLDSGQRTGLDPAVVNS